MARRRPDPEARITPEEAENAIYVDCEGLKHEAPSLIGIQIRDQIDQVVLDPVLAKVAVARNHRLSSLKIEVVNILERARAESRVIVAYTQHEKKLFKEFADVDVSAVYRDARKIAKYWKNALHSEEEIPGRALKDYLKLVGYPRGAHLGDKKTTKRIKAVRDMIDKRGSYEALTPTKKGQWTKLIDHNRIDCDGMRALVIQCAVELKARDEA